MLKIGELASQTGLSVEALRYYERRDLLSPTQRSNAGYRLYHPASVERIRFILRCKQLGFSLDEVQQILTLSGDPQTPSAEIKQRVEDKLELIEQKIADLTQLRDSLNRVSKLCSGAGTVGDCPIIDYLQQPDS